MKKFINKKNMKKFIIISAIIGIGFLGINYIFCYPTKINAYVAANVYSEPANSYFEDDNFYQCVVDAYNSTNNTSLPYTINLSNSQLQTITKLYCINDGIVSAKGLETMINLTTLSLVQNKLTELDVSDNVLLTTLAISNNQLIELNLKGALSLTELDIKYNQLENIDISNNVELKRLSAQGNQLTNLNTSNNLKLEDLDLSINKIQSLDLRNNDLLIDLNLWQNQITEIDLSKNVLLDDLSVSDNQLTKLDVSNNQALRTLNVSNNQLTSLDLSNNAKLESLSAAYNKLSNLDINNNIALKSLGLSENDLKQIILDKNINLNILTLNDNELTELDVSKNTNLTSLKIDGNELSSLDVSKNTNLTAIHVGANQLKSLNLDNNISLVNLSIYNNQLTSLDVSKNTALKYLYAQNNELTSLVVSGTTSLSSLNVANNKLKDLNISNNISLTELRAYNNSLDELDVSENAGLKILDISNNKLNDIDVSNNVLLEALLIDGNNLSYLDISNNNNLSAGSGCKHDTAKALCINDVSKEKAIYKGDTYQYEELIKYPISWNIDYYTSTYSDSERKNIVQSSEATKDENSITPITLDYIYIARGNNILNGYGITTTYINLYVIEATSEKYKINDDYIYTGSDTDTNTILNNININYGAKEINNNQLLIKYNDELLKSFDLKSISFGEIKSGVGFILWTENMSYTDLVSNITLSKGLSYKVFNGNAEVTSGNIEKGMTLKVYYNEEVLDVYSVMDEYFKFKEGVYVDEVSKYLTSFKDNTTVSEVLDKIDTNVSVDIVDKDGNKLESDDIVGTGTTVEINLSSGKVIYTIVIIGDVNGDGQIDTADAYSVVLHSVEKIKLEGSYLEAGYTTNNSEEVTTQDAYNIVLYSIKGKEMERID